MTINLSRLWPVLRSSQYLGQQGFVCERLPARELAVVWVEVGPRGVLYVTPDCVAAWEAAAVPWRQHGLANLRDATRERVFTHAEQRADGSPLWAGMLHSDGFGASRVFLRDGIEYYLGVATCRRTSRWSRQTAPWLE